MYNDKDMQIPRQNCYTQPKLDLIKDNKLKMYTEEKESLLMFVFGLSKQLGKIPFSTLVKQSTGFDLIPINYRESSDKILIDTTIL